MESAQDLKVIELKNAQRQAALLSWLRAVCGLPNPELLPMHGDASFRRYFRVQWNSKSVVVMDAPPPQENCRPFVAIANALRKIGLVTPDILHADLDQGFLMITDFGDATYLKTLNSANADQLYRNALTALATMQQANQVADHVILPFIADFMQKEWDWHKEWFLEKLLGLPAPSAELDLCYELIVQAATAQPQVFMHRDYHSANLMVLPDNGVGMLDFQDAFIGPVTYDLVSLLRDCYIDWPPEQVKAWALFYYQQLSAQSVLQQVDAATFLRWFDLMGLQRHLKALLTFGRKQVRDHQPHYLQFIPRTLAYIVQVSAQYPELAVLHAYYQSIVLPAFAKVPR